jgi:hypothetical protein
LALLDLEREADSDGFQRRSDCSMVRRQNISAILERGDNPSSNAGGLR